MGMPKLEVAEIFRRDRFPIVVVTLRGTVLLIWGLETVRVRRSEDGGLTWGRALTIAKGIHSGGTIVDDVTGDILAFVEDCHPPAPLRMYRSADDGQTWSEMLVHISP